MRKFIAAVAVVALSGCATEIPLNKTYSGTLPAQSGNGKGVRLDLEFLDKSGVVYKPMVVAVQQYRLIAEDALQKAGYQLQEQPDVVVRVVLTGQTEKGGLVASNSNFGRNALVSAASLGIACDEMAHQVAASGHVMFAAEARDETRPVEMHAEDTSCFSKLNPNWLTNHQEAALKLYQDAVIRNVGEWLELLARR